jgi:hypothetical protein
MGILHYRTEDISNEKSFASASADAASHSGLRGGRIPIAVTRAVTGRIR